MKNIISSVFNKDNNSPEFQKLTERWDNYLSKLKDRYYEILKDAEGPLQSVIDNLQYDTVVIHNIKTGLHNQTVEQLSKKAEEGWAKMETEMHNISVSFDQIQEQHRKTDDLRQWMEWEFTVFEVTTYGRAARQILENVKKHIDDKKLHRCTQCAAELPIKIYSFMAVNIKCDSCGSVNTYQPDDRIRALEYYVLNHLAEEQAYPFKLKAKSDKNAMMDYYKTYYGFLMENVPDKAEFYKKDMEERINNPFFKNAF
ncbi:MAG TPA: hypothetical protein PKC58_14380 [Ignavibacteria bacterium]|nr:hypothetical protein [Ignavibacteria bacterium]